MSEQRYYIRDNIDSMWWARKGYKYDGCECTWCEDFKDAGTFTMAEAKAAIAAVHIQVDPELVPVEHLGKPAPAETTTAEPVIADWWDRYLGEGAK